jgi:succinate dehydrogenase / fumarate reductase iron-sulfur subunit
MSTSAAFKVWRSDDAGGHYEDFSVDVVPGMVVLDAIHQIQATQAGDLAVRWNCKAGKCGSCSAEINGNPRLMCMTRLNTLNLLEPVTVEPMRAFPLIKDLVTDVSWNYPPEDHKPSRRDRPTRPTAPGACSRRTSTACRSPEVHRVLLPDVCHVLWDHKLHDQFIGPRFDPRRRARDAPAGLGGSRRELKNVHGVGWPHHALLHEGPPGAHHDHRECDHSAWARGRPLLRSADQASPRLEVLGGLRRAARRSLPAVVPLVMG